MVSGLFGDTYKNVIPLLFVKVIGMSGVQFSDKTGLISNRPSERVERA